MRRLGYLAVLGIMFFATGTVSAGVVSEEIYFIEEDGRNAVVYRTNRTSYENYTMWLRRRSGGNPENHLENFLYLFPRDHAWDTKTEKGYDLLRFAGGDYASLEQVALDSASAVQISEAGVYTYRSWDGTRKTPDGHYGVWNAPDPFEQIAYSWVFPNNLEPVSYSANRAGEWVRRESTITYYGKDVNDLVFTIKYRPYSNDTYKALKSGLDGEDRVLIEQQSDGVKLTLQETVLFPSGVADLSNSGKTVLGNVAATLKDRNDSSITVGGHTDNVPIGPNLVQRYPSNWELSAGRALAVVHYLAQQGVAESRMEARAYGSERPIEPNTSDEGRRKNRRIELFIQEPTEN